MVVRFLELPSLVRTVRSAVSSPTGQRVTLLAASSAFVVGGVIAVRRTDLDPQQFNFQPLILLVLLGIPATVALNALEYHVSARILGQSPPVSSSFRVTILATAANLLPIPGAALVKIEALQRRGARTNTAFSVTAFIGLTWLGMALLFSSLATAAMDERDASARFGIGAFAVLVVAFGLARTLVKPWSRAIRTLFGVMLLEGVAILITAGRLALAFSTLGEVVSIGSSVVIALSGVVAAAIGIFPGGLGLQEWLAAVLAPIVNVEPASAFLASALDRIVGGFVLGALAAILVIPTRGRIRREQRSDVDRTLPEALDGAGQEDSDGTDPRIG